MQIDVVEPGIVTEPEDLLKMPIKRIRNLALSFAMEEVVELPVNRFLGNALDEDKMASMVDPSLYRKRA